MSSSTSEPSSSSSSSLSSPESEAAPAEDQSTESSEYEEPASESSLEPKRKEKKTPVDQLLTKQKSTGKLNLSSSGRQPKHRPSGKEISNTFREKTGTVEPIHLTWNNINYSVKDKKKSSEKLSKEEKKAAKAKGKKGKKAKQEKVILRGQCGEVKPGRLLAIMGSSGAGKTSLLNVLARRTMRHVEGEVLLNGAEVDTRRFRRICAYVQQDDVMLPWVSVRETLRFAANLRLPNTLSAAEKNERVEAVIEELGLLSVADTPIGSPEKRGISGGERKRVTIGIELITNPSVVFLDEPTSGLDSFTALNIMDTLVNLARKGRTVVCTIHQPRSNIFDLMDKLLILAKGETLYFGDANKAIDYWSALGFNCPRFTNPADFFLDTTTVDQRTPEVKAASEAVIKKFAKNWAKHHAKTYEPPDNLEAPTGGAKYAVNRLVQFGHIFKRAFLSGLRDKAANIIRLVQTVVVTLLISFLYYQINNDQTAITDRSGAMFFLMINMSFGQLIGGLAIFYQQKGTYLRERSNGTYSVGAYYWAKSLAELPQQILWPCVTALVCYWIIGFRPDVSAYFTFVLLLWLVSMCAGSLAFTLGAALPNADAANAAAPFILVIYIIFGGFYVNSVNIPDYFSWIEKISFFSYGFRALLVNEFWNSTFVCTEDQLVSTGNVSICPIDSGYKALKLFGLNYDEPEYNRAEIWQDAAVLAAMVVIYRILAYLGLRFLTGRAKA